MRTHEELVNTLMNCAATCEYCATACLKEEDIDMMRNCIMLDRDCADICRLTATLLSRNSDNTDRILEVCAEVCQKCADECKHHEHDHCQDCARVCSDCAEACMEFH
jgi:hypothetical protein